MKRIEAVNDFVVKFANVNGSGSASANELFAKAILRMGVPVSPRNIFPSNIQGLPTWYEVRVSEHGWLGRRGGVDMMVAMNPQTWDQDVAEIEPGGYLFYDSTRPLPPSSASATTSTSSACRSPRSATPPTKTRASAQLFKNIMVLGALSVLMDVDAAVIEELFAEQYRGKERLLESNVRALHAGAQLRARPPASRRSACACGAPTRWATTSSSTATAPRRWAACTAAPRSAPGTRSRRRRRWPRPSRSTARSTASTRPPARTATPSCRPRTRSPRIGMVVGAGWNGARAFTATSGPGVSLMTEFIGLAYFAEIPVTIINVQRGGPSTGMPTRTQQADLLSLRLRLARRHQARDAAAAGPGRVLRIRRRGAGPGRPPADAGLRDDRPGHRHEPAPVRSPSSGTTRAATTAAR